MQPKDDELCFTIGGVGGDDDAAADSNASGADLNISGNSTCYGNSNSGNSGGNSGGHRSRSPPSSSPPPSPSPPLLLNNTQTRPNAPFTREHE